MIGSHKFLPYTDAMFDALLRRLTAPTPSHLPESEADLALAALLVRVARADGSYDPAEAARIDRVLASRQALTPEAAAKLRAEAEALEAQAPDTVRFTRAIKDVVPLNHRAELLQAMWSVALTDTQRDAGEDQVIRLVAKLLGLTDRDSAEARQRAQQE